MRIGALGLAAALLGVSAQGGEGPAGAAVGDAGAAVAMVRLVADSVPETSILPELGEVVSPTASFEAGFGLSNAQANSAAALPYERSVAQATPYGAALTDRAPSAAGGLIQTAGPDNPKPDRGVLKRPKTPVDALVNTGTLSGSVHARWSDDKGGCVGDIAVATTESDAVQLGNAIPTLPDIGFDKLKLPGGAKLATSFKPRGKLGTLGGLLGGPRAAQRVLVNLPKGLSTRSTVELVEQAKRKAIRSTSQVRAERIGLLTGSVIGMTATVRRSPTLAVTATGVPKTSRISNQVAEISVRRGGQTLFRLDKAHPRRDIPIGVPKAAFKLGTQKVKSVPIVGGIAENAKGKAVRLSASARRQVVDLFVLRLSVGGLNTKSADITTPFDGHQVAATARLLDVQLLPTKALVDALRGRYDVPSTLAQYAVGEQVVRAAAPEDGAQCGRPGAGDGGQSALPAVINTSSPSAGMRPLLWVGATSLLGGSALLVAFRPRRTPRPGPQKAG